MTGADESKRETKWSIRERGGGGDGWKQQQEKKKKRPKLEAHKLPMSALKL